MENLGVKIKMANNLHQNFLMQFIRTVRIFFISNLQLCICVSCVAGLMDFGIDKD